VNAINIISFDVPYPPNYGGIIDVFYKVKYFHSKGIKVHLHCFEYGRGEHKELEKYCQAVKYYKRKTGIISFLSFLPYIVNSRKSDELKNNLLQNDYPILFEGLHSCFLLGDKAFENRLKIFRESNIEHDYYRHLAFIEKNPLKRFYFLTEAKKLEKFEPVIQKADLSLIVSSKDFQYFKEKYPNSNIEFIPSFHPSAKINSKPGLGNYVLYHGNLSVAENINAAKYIISIMKDLDILLKIAGLSPSKELIDLTKKYNIELIQNPNDDQLQSLIENAQINFLYTDQATGLKLKLLNVLYNGRHCIVNSKMVHGTTLNKLCIVEDDKEKLKNIIVKYFNQEFSFEQLEKRKIVLKKDYSNENSYNKLINANHNISKMGTELV
jgi:hypothetical protein